ncbi:hypothetical protein [Dyadobacter sp. CY261]
MSANDDLRSMQKKIQEEWIENGCRLAWLINTANRNRFHLPRQ